MAHWKAWGDHPGYVILSAIGTIVAIIVAIKPPNGTGQPPQPQTPQLQTRGVVSDIKTRKPVVGAKITFRFKDFSRTVYTDDEGVYKLPLRSDADGQEGYIRVDKDEYDVYTRHITIDRIFEEIVLTPKQERTTGGGEAVQKNVRPAPTSEKRAPNPNWPYCEPVESGYIHPLCAERLLRAR